MNRRSIAEGTHGYDIIIDTQHLLVANRKESLGDFGKMLKMVDGGRRCVAIAKIIAERR
jgi:hypothetical protein